MEEGKKLLVIDPKTKSFTANGKEYLVENEISFQRWRKYQKLQIELGYNTSFEKLFTDLSKCYELLNQQKFADSAVAIRDIMKGIKDIQEQKHPAALQLCTLFINTSDEDRRYISEDLMDRKIDDWEKEGYDIGSFFQLALGIIPGFLQTYKLISQDI